MTAKRIPRRMPETICRVDLIPDQADAIENMPILAFFEVVSSRLGSVAMITSTAKRIDAEFKINAVE